MNLKRSLIGGIASVVCICSLFSCGKAVNTPVRRIEAKWILESRYGRIFTKVSDDLDKYGKGTIVFKDNEGVQCEVIVRTQNVGTREFFSDYKYVASENYPRAYYSAHKELFEPLNENGHKFVIEDNNNFIMYYDSFEDIDEVVDFTFKKIGQMESIVQFLKEDEIKIIKPAITFTPSNFKYPLSTIISFLPEDDQQSDHTHVADQIKRNFIYELRQNNDIEELSKLTNEQLMYDPLNVIDKVTYNGEEVLYNMYFEENTGSRSGKSRCYSYYAFFNSPSSDTGRNSLEKLLKNIGWQTTVKRNSVSFSNGSDILMIKNKAVTLNNKPYELDGQSDFWDDGQIKITFTEKDFRDIFGIEFEFDQIDGTGKIVKCGS